MIYIQRDNQNQIKDILFSPETGYIEASLFDPEIKEFLSNNQNDQLIKKVLLNLDLDLVRVIEDMVDLLIDKNIILFTELPEPVQNKLLFKKTLRHSLNPSINLIDEEEILNF